MSRETFTIFYMGGLGVLGFMCFAVCEGGRGNVDLQFTYSTDVGLGLHPTPYWHRLLIRHNLDVMHIEKNVFENIFNTVMDTSKTKDNIKARKDREIYCDRANLHTWSENNKIIKPKASYTLTKPQVNKVCEWVKEVIFPDGYASNIGGCVNLKDCSFYSFKSHECHVFMQHFLPIALKGMIPNAIWDAITELCTFFHTICTKVLHIQDMEKLGESIVVTICKLLEKVFPPGFFDSMENLVIHLANEAILGDPVQYRWMYIYERQVFTRFLDHNILS
ncbi:putative transposon, En/Spm-like protein [Tanacetum coccineum]